MSVVCHAISIAGGPNVVVLICVPDLQLIVHPKIPAEHLFYILAASGRFPRLDEYRGHIASDESLWHLVAAWYISTVERLLRRDLIRDYHPIVDSLMFLRGRAHVPSTTHAYYSGRLAITCEFDDFNTNSPLNRILLAAAHVVAASPILSSHLRRRARAVLSRMDGVNDLEPGDLRYEPDRRTSHYSDAITLGRHILRNTGRTLATGEAVSWTFLIRTPEMVEDGVRALLRNLLPVSWDVRKRRIHLQGSTLTVNPDVVFGEERALADIKYKLATADWVRSDLYEVTSFAVALRTDVAAILSFVTTNAPPRMPVRIGDIWITDLRWRALSGIAPVDAAANIAGNIQEWLLPSRPAQ